MSRSSLLPAAAQKKKVIMKQVDVPEPVLPVQC